MNLTRMIIQLWLPTIIIIFGLVEALIIPFLGGKRRFIRRLSVKVMILMTTILMISAYGEVQKGPIIYEIANVFGNGIIFKIDYLNYTLMLFAGLMWLIVSIYSSVDVKNIGRERSFFFFFTITYISTLGTLMAGDLLSFFLFFEIMTFSSYALMVHRRGTEIIEAGNTYIYMGIIGGLSILSGILMLSAYTQSYEWVNLAEKFSQMGMIKYIISGLFIFGFGVKAGMVPFHFWVPKIYVGAPISVNALSSGILMKVGAYGILRVVVTILSTSQEVAVSAEAIVWSTSENLGVVIIWLGILTMVVGVFMALQQANMKRMLAYHSVSQMGYIIMGIGVAAYLGYQGAMGFSGSLYHMVNHGLFKALLFMVAGAVYMRTKELDMYQLGGLWRKMPFTAFVALIAVFGITGMPGFNGFASKSILHHAIIEAYEYGHPSFRYAEMLFTLVSAGTVCSFLKFYGFIFLGKCPEEHQKIEGDDPKMSLAMGILAMLIVLIGLNPSVFLNIMIIPGLMSFTYDPAFIDKYIVGMNFWNSQDLISMVGVYALGTGIFIVGLKYHLFHLHLPKWLNAEKFLYKPVTDFCEEFPNYCVQRFEKRMIFGDVFIYAILLTVIMGLLVISGLQA
ncbi:NADH dehydrogenase (quinone) [Alkaliphilus metalliredigens QYMF]|uniref:NADH dehydrogenase (Quinone) n=1 Tax=Alkaliphilus metalliredigens (strain QYMF) TaxID=293826 RepID=A6TVL3_ALKMQ|nr:complex I subunit 5 family protein [Alkaliphilus metalliredigens]ABR50231.1 NADH dehydrogenase (quinone) [Alkaliphilus metalliredigens QYMF]